MTPKMARPSGVRGDVDGSVTSRCSPRNTAVGISRIDEIRHARHGQVERAGAEQRRRRRRRHRRDREEVHDDEADDEQHGVDARAQAEGGGDLLSPGEVRRVRSRAAPAKTRASVNADGLKMCTRRPSRFHRTNALPMNPSAISSELQDEPVVLEPEKQVRAEDDRKRTEAEHVLFAARPRQQHVERVGEEQLREEQRHEVVDRRPVPAPVGVDGELAKALDVMLGRGGVPARIVAGPRGRARARPATRPARRPRPRRTRSGPRSGAPAAAG